MKTGTLVSLIALIVSFIGLAIALVLFFKKKKDNESDFLDGYEDIAYNASNMEPVSEPAGYEVEDRLNDDTTVDIAVDGSNSTGNGNNIDDLIKEAKDIAKDL